MGFIGDDESTTGNIMVLRIQQVTKDRDRKKMKRVLVVTTVVRLHINMFHKPFIKWFHD